MKTIKFGSASYDLVDSINVDAARLQATVYKGESSVEQIASIVEDAGSITVYEDGQVIGQYSGYNTPIAFSLYYTDAGVPVVSIEVANTNTVSNMVSSITDINAHLGTVDEEIGSIDSGIIDLSEGVAGLEGSQQSQDAAIEDLAEIIGEL